MGTVRTAYCYLVLVFTYKFENGMSYPTHPYPSYLYSLIRLETEKQYPKPLVPTDRVLVDIDVFGDVPNPNQPEYLALLLVWEAKVNAEFGAKFDKALLLYCIDCPTDHAQIAIQNLIVAVRTIGIELELSSDVKWEYIDKILLSSPQAKAKFVESLISENQPTEILIEAYKQSFGVMYEENGQVKSIWDYPHKGTNPIQYGSIEYIARQVCQSLQIDFDTEWANKTSEQKSGHMAYWLTRLQEQSVASQLERGDEND